jgi:hypothetical protein
MNKQVFFLFIHQQHAKIVGIEGLADNLGRFSINSSSCAALVPQGYGMEYL